MLPGRNIIIQRIRHTHPQPHFPNGVSPLGKGVCVCGVVLLTSLLGFVLVFRVWGAVFPFRSCFSFAGGFCPFLSLGRKTAGGKRRQRKETQPPRLLALTTLGICKAEVLTHRKPLSWFTCALAPLLGTPNLHNHSLSGFCWPSLNFSVALCALAHGRKALGQPWGLWGCFGSLLGGQACDRQIPS